MARVDLGDVLTEAYGNHIPATTDAVPADPADLEEHKKKMKDNRKAAGILLNSILTDTDEGQVAFYEVDQYHSEADGYPGGHFYKAWKALKERYETVVEDTVDKLKTKYYGCKMNLMDDPTIFVNKMDRIQAKMKKKGFTIEDAEFLKDVMNRLPRSGDPKTMGPYEITKKLIENSDDLDKVKLLKALEETSRDIKDRSEELGEKSFYAGGGRKQFKRFRRGVEYLKKSHRRYPK